MSALITIDATDWPAAGFHLPGLAGHFGPQVHSSSPAQVVVVNGAQKGWPGVAERGASAGKNVLIVDPVTSSSYASLEALDAVVAAAQGSGAAVVVGDAWIRASSLDSLRREWAQHTAAGIVLVDLVTYVEATSPGSSDDLGHWGMLRMLSVLDAGLGLRPTLVTAVEREGAVLMAGRDPQTGSAPVLLRSIGTPCEASCTVTVVLSGGALTWTLPGRGDATPSTVQVSGDGGTRLLPTRYESPYRQALLRAHAAVDKPVQRAGDAAEPDIPRIDELSPLIAVRRHFDAELQRLGSS